MSDNTIELLTIQINELKQLFEISKNITGISKPKILVDVILNTVTSELESSYAALFLQSSMDSPVFSIGTNFRGDFPLADKTGSLDGRSTAIKFLANAKSCYTMNELRYLVKSDAEIMPLIEINPSLIIPLKATTALTGFLIVGEKLDTTDGAEYSMEAKTKIVTIAPFIAMALYNAMLLDMTTTDMMTKLRLKHYFYAVLFSNLEISVSKRVALSVLMTDIDFFKKVNDTYGHACGDYVLIQVAKLVKESIRDGDMAARYGGEEFVVMLHETDKDTAMLVAERIRKRVEEARFVYEGQELHLTISIGVASCQDKLILSAREMVNYADQALYVSKESGRNRVTFASEELILKSLGLPITPEDIPEI